jgi:hypothetical protein
LPATMMKRYVLCSGSSGMAYIALFCSLSAMRLLTSILCEAFQDGPTTSSYSTSESNRRALAGLPGLRIKLVSTVGHRTSLLWTYVAAAPDSSSRHNRRSSATNPFHFGA